MFSTPNSSPNSSPRGSSSTSSLNGAPSSAPGGAHSGRGVARWAGPALVAAAAVNLFAEAVVASAWDQRPYSYTQDYVNFLGSPYAGTFTSTLGSVVISSPLWWLMSTAWVATGVLIAAAALAMRAPLTGWRRRATSALGLAAGIALVLFAAFPLGPARMGDPTLVLYLLGAFGSIIAGNALAVVIGLSAPRLRLPRWLGTTSVALGVIGLVNIPATYGWTPTGVAERLSVYPYLAWALLTGIALIVGSTQSRRPTR